MSAIDGFLARLDGVKQTRDGRWLARCPSHDDRHPSLSVAEGDDGRVLIKCWAGCGAGEVLGAAGMTFSDLFPPKPISGDYAPSIKRPFSAADILRAVNLEMTVAEIALCDLSKGVDLSDEDFARLRLASERIRAAAAEYA